MALLPTINELTKDIQGGGQIANVYNNLTNQALNQKKLQLANQYYGPDIESKIGIRNALTTGQNIHNEYLPEQYRLANQHAGLVNQFYSKDMLNKIAAAEFKRNNPLLFASGAAGQIGAEMYLRQHPELQSHPQQQSQVNLPPPMPMQQLGNQIGNNPVQNMANNLNTFPLPQSLPMEQKASNNIDYADQLHQSMNASNAAKKARADLDTARTEGYAWSQMPAETRNNIIAQGLGMGVDPQKMRKYFNQGLDTRQIAEKEGLDPENIPPPIYYPTSTTKTRNQQQLQVDAELTYMSSMVSQAIKPYASTFLNKSGKAITDMLSNDPEKQKQFGEYLGALALQNELSNARILLSGGKSGVELVRDLKDKSLSGIHQISPIRMTPTIYDSSQKFMDKVLHKGARIRTQTGMSPFSGRNKKHVKSGSSAKNENNKPGKKMSLADVDREIKKAEEELDKLRNK